MADEDRVYGLRTYVPAGTPLPNIVRLFMMHGAIKSEPNDPEDTLQLALTHRDLAMFLGGAVLIGTIFPEFEDEVKEMMTKLQEITGAQEFLPEHRAPEDDE